MNRSVRSEVAKVATTRALWWMAALALAVPVFVVMGVPRGALDLSRPLREQQFAMFWNLVRIPIVVVGVRMVVDDFRYSTIVPTLLVSPDRRRLIASKVVAASATGLAVAAASMAVLLAVASFAIRGFDVGAGDLGFVAAGVASGALWGAIGAGVGAVVRSQLPAVLGPVVWLLVGEEVVAARIGSIGEYLPGGAGFAMTVSSSAAQAAAGAAILVAYAAALALAGALVLERSDIS